MNIGNEIQAAGIVALLHPVSAANTAAATSAWVAVPKPAIGAIEIEAHVGALTGSITWTLETASDDSGTGATAVTPTEGAFSAGAANTVQKRTFDAKISLGYVKLTGTIVTGPALVQAAAKYLVG
jgi:hypothetical protein